mgnify:CR=1 FL=1
MLVGVVSDSHDDLESTRRVGQRLRELGVKLVIHLGDIVAPFTLRELVKASGARVEGVFGNNDAEIPALLQAAQESGSRIEWWPRILELDGKRLLLMHGSGPATVTSEVARALAESGHFSAVLYGHTHVPELTYVRGVLLLNPGPVSSFIGGPSLAVVDTETLAARLIRL